MEQFGNIDSFVVETIVRLETSASSRLVPMSSAHPWLKLQSSRLRLVYAPTPNLKWANRLPATADADQPVGRPPNRGGLYEFRALCSGAVPINTSRHLSISCYGR